MVREESEEVYAREQIWLLLDVHHVPHVWNLITQNILLSFNTRTKYKIENFPWGCAQLRSLDCLICHDIAMNKQANSYISARLVFLAFFHKYEVCTYIEHACTNVL